MTSSKRATVLIVDDEPAILSSLERLLRREFTILLATSATTGLDLLRLHAPQIVISDQRMPGITGSDFLAQVGREQPDVVRLLLTGYADLDSVIGAINKGEVYRYLVKPWNPDELRSTVREAAERYQLVTQNRALLGQLIETNAALEQRVAERTTDLAAANQRLQELDRLKDELLAVTSHDLRSLVTNIRLSSQMLLRGNRTGKGDPERYIQAIAHATDRLLVLLNDLSDLTMINTGALQLQRGPVLLSDIAQAVVHDALGLAEAKTIAIHVQVPEQEPLVQADHERLYQVVSNLVGNAIKLTPSGGQIAVTVQPTGHRIALSIRDTGIGLPAEQLPELFTQFKHMSRPGTDGERGSGLGLAIVHRLVELHEGEIAVASVEGQGSTFTIALPLQVAPAEMPSPE